MSDTQNPIAEEVIDVASSEVASEVAISETQIDSSSQAASSVSHSERAPRTDRPKTGDRPRGRRDGGMREEEKEFKEEMLSIDRVTRVTAWGRQIRFRASVVIGDGKGRIGLGTGKAGEVQMAIEKAIRDAKKHLITFPMVNGTIPHDVSVEYKASGLYIHPAHPGTGIIAWGAVRKIFAVSGIRDIIAKQHGAPNDITNARVTLKALASLKPLALIKKFASKNPAIKEESPKAEKKSETVVAKKDPVVKTETAEKKTPAKKAPAKKKAE